MVEGISRHLLSDGVEVVASGLSSNQERKQRQENLLEFGCNSLTLVTPTYWVLKLSPWPLQICCGPYAHVHIHKQMIPVMKYFSKINCHNGQNKWQKLQWLKSTDVHAFPVIKTEVPALACASWTVWRSGKGPSPPQPTSAIDQKSTKSPPPQFLLLWFHGLLSVSASLNSPL